MRVRIKFSKTGSLKYIGHLDVMRFFQKAIRRAGLDVVYSEGFSPHMQMSFAQPLGVGMTSRAEYFDLDLKTAESSKRMVGLLNEQMPGEMEILSIVQIPEDKASKCMSLVAAADYAVRIVGEDICEYADKFAAFTARDKIEVLKKTKRSEALTDIKPFIYDYRFEDGALILRLGAGSVNNLKPSLVMSAFWQAQGRDASNVELAIERRELLADISERCERTADAGGKSEPTAGVNVRCAASEAAEDRSEVSADADVRRRFVPLCELGEEIV